MMMTQLSDYATLVHAPKEAYAELIRLREENARLREALNGLLARFEDGCGTCHLSPEEWDHLKFGIPALKEPS